PAHREAVGGRLDGPVGRDVLPEDRVIDLPLQACRGRAADLDHLAGRRLLEEAVAHAGVHDRAVRDPARRGLAAGLADRDGAGRDDGPVVIEHAAGDHGLRAVDELERAARAVPVAAHRDAVLDVLLARVAAEETATQRRRAGVDVDAAAGLG